ncbi:hypothetical protein [Micromonospora siamensis]|uniref:Uncharacterized protein n=1 Tax=Micromonospora siamensis TaxID=299152 RepID=A0A1C5IYJ9_9ACTN|nr:hypothetical protein [Micromonospora siamensis]SCG63412.1 hypothetical protein GA0074704_3940 [Micromonospora siamensis]
MPDEPDDDLHRDLTRMAGSPAVAEEVRRGLRRLADGAASPELAEMARDVLAGRVNVRAAAGSEALADQMSEAIGRFQQWQAELTEEEGEQFLADARARLGREED